MDSMGHGSVIQHISQQKSAGRTWSIQWNSSFPGRSSFCCWVGNDPTSWWFQPILKICSSNWIISLGIGVKIKKHLKPQPSPSAPFDPSESAFWSTRVKPMKTSGWAWKAEFLVIFGDCSFSRFLSFWREETSRFFFWKSLQIHRIFNDYNPWYLTSG